MAIDGNTDSNVFSQEQNINIVSKVVTKEKGSSGEEQKTYNIGSTFDKIIGKDLNGKKLTLQYFFDHYQNYLNNANFLYSGPVQPKNIQTAIWIEPRHLEGNGDSYETKVPPETTKTYTGYETLLK